MSVANELSDAMSTTVQAHVASMDTCGADLALVLAMT